MASLQDVAREAQVSPRTVARVLSGSNKEVWPSAAATAARIRSIADRLGYRPNAAARATRAGRFNSIALLTSSVPDRSVLPNPLTDAIFDALAALDLHLAVARVTDQQWADPHFVPKVMAQRLCDGLLVHLPLGVPARAPDLIDRTGLPAVWLGHQRPDDAVYADDVDAAVRATQLLLDKGHRRIAYADYEHGHRIPPFGPAANRRAGYEQAMRAAGLAPRYLCDIESVREAMEHQPTDFHGGRRLRYSLRWMTPDDCPTAVLAYGHETAIPIMLAAERTGRRFPDQFSLVTFGEMLWQTSLSCDGMVLPNPELGASAVQMLHDKINHPGSLIPSRTLNYWYRSGHTVGPPRAG